MPRSDDEHSRSPKHVTGDRHSVLPDARAALHEVENAVHALDAQLRETTAKVEARTGRNLFAALAIGIVMGGLLIVSLVVEKQFFTAYVALLVGFATWELATISRTENRYVPRIPLLISAVAMMPATYYLGQIGQLLTLALGIVFVIVWHTTFRLASRSQVTDRDLLMSGFVLAYVPFLASFAVLMTARDGGEWWTLGTMIIIASTDTGAYASGLMFGKHPMAPKISPKKTWEGFAGSVVAAVTAGTIIAVTMIDQPWFIGSVLGLIIVATATTGDLIESLIKRDLATKDASNLLPGHGGFLDRLDSVLPSMFVASVFAIVVA
ncbi:MAG: hypothetical protein RIS25_950 [Actinomycetota bacterium]|jgi:phosphatidate cytidylyltransferase